MGGGGLVRVLMGALTVTSFVSLMLPYVVYGWYTATAFTNFLCAGVNDVSMMSWGKS